MRVVLAPDSFKGTLTAAEAARTLADGWRDVRPDDELVLLPMADGGEGTLDAIAAATPDARRLPVTATGPDDYPVDTHWLLLPNGTAVVELALTSGLTLLDELAPLTAHTLGLGHAIAAALDHGVTRVVVAVGGSASTDGGAGMLTALGAHLTGPADGPVARGVVGLEQLERVDLTSLRALPPGGVLALTDVDSPLLGERGAAAVFGPQKGLDSSALVARAEAALERFAAAMAVERPTLDPSTPGAGAAGGTGFGLLALGARLAAGAPSVADTIGFDAALDGADLVVTGEGRFDGQTAAGKVAHEVARRADARGTPRALVAGRIDAPTAGYATAIDLTTLTGGGAAGSAAAMANPRRWLREAGALLARDAGAGGSPSA